MLLAAIGAATLFGGDAPIVSRTAGPRVAQTLRLAEGQQTSGVQWAGALGIQVTTSELMAAQARAARPLPALRRRGAPERNPSRPTLPQDLNSPLVSQWPPPTSQSLKDQRASEPRLPQSVAFSFTAATLADAGAFPPDSMGAVGPSQFLLGINGRIRTFNKSGVADGVLDVTMNTFFASVRNGSGTSDPRVRFDRLSGRWIVTIINVTTPNRVLIGVSSAGTITSSTIWTLFFFLQNQVEPVGDPLCLSDYPTLGVDVSALYIGVNQFCSEYGGTAAFVVRKSSILGAGPIVVTAFRNLTTTPTGAGPFTPQGVDNFDPAATEGYFVAVDNSSFGRLVVRRVTNPAGAPSISPNLFVTVPATAYPITVRHRGNTGGTEGELDGLDDRLFDAQVRNGRLWAAHNIGVDHTGVATSTPSRNAVRWYELDGLSGTPALVQSGTLFTPSASNADFDQRNYWIPSITVSGQGHVAVGASTAGTNEFVNAATAGRLASDPPATLQAVSLYTGSNAAYNPPGDKGGTYGRRWGDYSYTSVDPCDDMTMWTIQEFADNVNSYGVRVAKLLAPPPASAIAVSPAGVAAGLTAVDVTITATRAGGAGYFDPGPGFACRLSATLSGLTVNSITYKSPTSLVLNISTVGAAVGQKTLAVTNPDGQRVTAASLFSVTAGSSQPIVTIDVPSAGPAVAQPFLLAGWALDVGSSMGTGIDTLHVYAYPNLGSGAPPIFLGVAAYGGARPDVAAVYGAQFTQSGFGLSVPTLPTGTYTLAVFPRSTVTGAFAPAQTVTVMVQAFQAQPRMWVDVPVAGTSVAQPFAVAGWAIDVSAAGGTGVDLIHVWAYPNPGSGAPPKFVGASTYGLPRPDVGAVFGSSFTSSGFSLTVNGLTAGVYQFVVFARSTVTGTFNNAQSVIVTVK